MTGLPGNLGDTNINELIAALKNARDTGRAVLKGALDGLANNPQLKGIVDQLRGLLSKPVIELTDAELDDLINARHAGNQAKSKAWVDDEPAPPPPPPKPNEFPYMKALDTRPDLAKLKAGLDKVYRSAEGKFTVWPGVAAQPNDFYPDGGTIWKRLPEAEQP